jgi:hypothetical protein
VIFTEPGGEARSQAQIRAFDDTWQWDREASELALSELGSKAPEVTEFISWLGGQRDKTSKSLTAYLASTTSLKKVIVFETSPLSAQRLALEGC